MRLATFDADRSVMPKHRQSIATSVQQLSPAAVQSVSTATSVKRNDQFVDRFEVSR